MKKPYNMRKTLRYASSFVAYVFITLADGKFTPFSLSLLFANVYIGLNPLGSFALYVLPFAASLDITVVWTSALGGLIVAVSATKAEKITRLCRAVRSVGCRCGSAVRGVRAKLRRRVEVCICRYNRSVGVPDDGSGQSVAYKRA